MFTLIFYNIITKLLPSTYSCIDFIHLIEKTINGCSIRQIFMKIVKHPPEDKSITLVRIKKKKTNKENVLSDDIYLSDTRRVSGRKCEEKRGNKKGSQISAPLLHTSASDLHS